MGVIEDVARFVAGASTGFTVASNVFANAMPERPDTALALYETGGVGPQKHLGGSTGTAWRNPRLQVVSRSTSRATARANAETAYKRLVGVANSTLAGSTSGAVFLEIVPLQEPFLLRVDEHNRPVFAFNVQVSRIDP